jgi:transposase-like protein
VKQIAVLREYQAHRLQELYLKSRRHLETERKQNDTLRKTLTESQNAALIEAMRSEIIQLKEEVKEVRRENNALKVCLFYDCIYA